LSPQLNICLIHLISLSKILFFQKLNLTDSSASAISVNHAFKYVHATVLFASQIDVAATAEHIQRQRRKNNEPDKSSTELTFYNNKLKRPPPQRHEPFPKSPDLPHASLAKLLNRS